MSEETTNDAAFGGIAADKLRQATAQQTAAVVAEEDGSAPDEPQPDQYPDEDA